MIRPNITQPADGRSSVRLAAPAPDHFCSHPAGTRLIRVLNITVVPLAVWHLLPAALTIFVQTVADYLSVISDILVVTRRFQEIHHIIIDARLHSLASRGSDRLQQQTFPLHAFIQSHVGAGHRITGHATPADSVIIGDVLANG